MHGSRDKKKRGKREERERKKKGGNYREVCFFDKISKSSSIQQMMRFDEREGRGWTEERRSCIPCRRRIRHPLPLTFLVFLPSLSLFPCFPLSLSLLIARFKSGERRGGSKRGQKIISTDLNTGTFDRIQARVTAHPNHQWMLKEMIMTIVIREKSGMEDFGRIREENEAGGRKQRGKILWLETTTNQREREKKERKSNQRERERRKSNP